MRVSTNYKLNFKILLLYCTNIINDMCQIYMYSQHCTALPTGEKGELHAVQHIIMNQPEYANINTNKSYIEA